MFGLNPVPPPHTLPTTPHHAQVVVCQDVQARDEAEAIKECVDDTGRPEETLSCTKTTTGGTKGYLWDCTAGPVARAAQAALAKLHDAQARWEQQEPPKANGTTV